jgi:hypothetical protein
MKKGEEWKTV